MAERGAIRCEVAYAQGKMLDNSGWSKLLPRKITPSDVDMVFDNAGRILFVELSSSATLWDEIAYGQRLMYWNLIRRTMNIAVLAKHCAPKTRQIDTVQDVTDCEVMFDCGGRQMVRTFAGNDAWIRMIRAFYLGEFDPVDWDNALSPETREYEDEFDFAHIEGLLEIPEMEEEGER